MKRLLAILLMLLVPLQFAGVAVARYAQFETHEQALRTAGSVVHHHHAETHAHGPLAQFALKNPAPDEPHSAHDHCHFHVGVFAAVTGCAHFVFPATVSETPPATADALPLALPSPLFRPPRTALA